MSAADHETARPGSIIDREQKWVAAQSVADLRQTVYMKLPPVIAANDLEGRKPFLALDALVGLLRQTEQERDEAQVDRSLAVRRQQNIYLYDQWGLRIVACEKTEPHEWHGWVGGNEDLRCPGVRQAEQEVERLKRGNQERETANAVEVEVSE